MATSLPVRTHCPYCAFQCGMVATRDGDGLAVAADPDFPVNNGQMCIKGFTSGDLLRRSDRITQPLLRDGNGGFREASWDEAMAFVAVEIGRIQSRHGRPAMAAFGSGALTNEKAYLLGKFVRVALRSPHVDYNGRYCMASAAAAMTRALGLDRGMPFPVADVAGAKTVMLWGSNLVDTLPPMWQYFVTMRDNGGRLIVVDPRRSATAAEADLHLQPTPGSDLCLANGLLHVAVEEDLIDRDYIGSRTTGFDAARASVGRYHPAYVERLTGVSEADLRQAARWMADERAMLLTGRGPEQQSKGVDGVSALINLMLALGHVGKPFAGYGTLTGQGNGQGGREHGQKADQLPGYRLIENDEHRAAVAKVWDVDPADLPGKGVSAVELIGKCGGDVRGLLVMGSNLPAATPDAAAVADKLASLDLLVVCDSFHNDATRLAHVVLPTLQWAEEDGTMTNLEGRVLRRRKAVEPPDGPRSDLDILCDLARRIGCGERFDFDSAEEVFNELRRATVGGVADYSGISHAKIDAQDGVYWPCPDDDHAGTPRLFGESFPTDDGRANFIAVEHRAAGEEPDADYPLWLTTGRYKQHYNTGPQTRGVATLRDQQPVARLSIHPQTAAAAGLDDGDEAEVQTRRGRARFVVDATYDVRPDTLFVPFHYAGDACANLLTNPALDPTSRMPEFKLCAARLVAREPEDDHDSR